MGARARVSAWLDRFGRAPLVVSAGRSVGGAAVSASRVLHTLVHPAARLWRRSLQVRVVSATLLVSAVLVATFGFLVAQQITAGLVRAKQNAANEQVEAGRRDAQEQLQAISGTDPQLQDTANRVVSRLSSSPGRAGTFEVVLMPGGAINHIGVQSLPHDAEAYISKALRRTVGERQVQAYEFIRANPDGGGLRPYLAVGTPVVVGWGVFELYYIFPLDDEVAAARLVRNTVVVTGTALVLLLAVVAGIVTRLVVRPVRAAARTAQRLSAGLLDQRMTVRGEDDLALLAASFNQMAVNLQRQIVRLEEMSRLQRRFTSDVSHELRTPLTTVRMAADVLYAARVDFPPEVARSAELLSAELDRFEVLLGDLLEISRFDAGFAVLDAEPLDLVPVVRAAARALGPVASRVGVPVELDLPAYPVIAEVDARRVERILRNLIGNAIEHGETRPVQVRLAAAEGAVAVTVRDRGVGLAPGEEKLVFNRFWRADQSRARQTGGSGLGLSISIEDARLHGGWLEAWGARGGGAQFRLTLPARAGERLVASPLRLVPDDADLVLDGGHHG